MPTNISDSGVNLLTDYEELHLEAYIAEPNGTIYTIGYGSYNRPGITAGSTITAAQAEAWLREDIAGFENHVNNVVNVELTQNQFDALVLFAFNTGAEANDSVWREINAGNYHQAMIEMAGWRSSNGQELRGLYARRNDEIELFMGGNSTREYNYTDHYDSQEEMVAFISAAVESGLNNGTLTAEDAVALFQTAQANNDQDLMRAYLNGLQASDASCFGPEASISMWPLDPEFAPDPNNPFKQYDQDAVRAKIWKKPIELIRVGDYVVSHDKNDNMVPGYVPRTMNNQAKVLLNFHGTPVTPGHVYYRPDSKKSYKYETLIDVLRDDGMIEHSDVVKLRAATNVPVGTPRDGFVQAVTGTLRADGGIDVKERGRIRLGTRFLVGEGKERKSFAVADLIEHGGGVVGDDELIRVGDGPGMPFHWDFGDTLPKPEDFVLACSQTTLEEIYNAAEWESQGPRLPAPMRLDRGPVEPLKGAALSAMPRNEPLDVSFDGMPTAKPQRTLNRKQRKAMEAKQRKEAKSRKPVVN